MLRRRSRPSPQSGQTLILGVVCMAVLVGALGFGIDIGVLRYQERVLQTVADSAAIGGAAELQYGMVATGAANAAALNNFVSGSGGDTLTVNNPPQSGPHAGNSLYVEVIAAKSAPTDFLNYFGIGTAALSARAVAYLGNGPNCIYALDPTADGALMNGSFNVNVQCGVAVNSNSSNALTANGSGTLQATSISVVGQVLDNGATLSPTPVTGTVPVNDPLGYLAAPSTAGSCASPTNISGSGTFNLSSGVYCSTVIINGNPTVNFGPGTYVLQGGMIMNGTPTLIGTGVTFYNESGGLTLNGSSSSTLSAPTSGSLAGILVFQSRTNSSTVTFNGTNTTAFNGAFYAPDATISDNGSGSGTYTILVGKQIAINGSASLTSDYNPLPGGSPIKAAVLVE